MEPGEVEGGAGTSAARREMAAPAHPCGLIRDAELIPSEFFDERITASCDNNVASISVTREDLPTINTELWQNCHRVPEQPGPNPGSILDCVETEVRSYIRDHFGNPLRAHNTFVLGVRAFDKALECVSFRLPEFEFCLSNNGIRASINGNQGTRSYVTDLATELWDSPIAQENSANVGELEQWLKDGADGVSNNSEFRPDFDPFYWDNEAFGTPGVRICGGVSCGQSTSTPGLKP